MNRIHSYRPCRGRTQPHKKKYNRRNNPQHSQTGVDSVYLVYPKGLPCWIWIRLNEEGTPCTRLYWKFPCAYRAIAMDTAGEYTPITTQVHPYLTIGKGTLLKCVCTRQNKVPVCTIRDIVWWKGNYVFHEPILPMLTRVPEMIGHLEPPILTKLYHPKNIRCVQLCVPLALSKQWTKLSDPAQKQAVLEYIDAIPYPVYDVMEYTMDQSSSHGIRHRMDDIRTRYIPKFPAKAICTMRAMEEHDSYALIDDKGKTYTYVVSTIKESRKINRWMGNIYGIDCLDDIEESDAEDCPSTEIRVECVRKGKTWIPIAVVE